MLKKIRSSLHYKAKIPLNYSKNGLNHRFHISLTLVVNIKSLNIFRPKKRFSFRKRAIQVKTV